MSKGSIIKFSLQNLRNMKEALWDTRNFQKKQGFYENVPQSKEHMLLENFNSINVVDVRLLKNQPIETEEKPVHSSLADTIKERIVDLKNILTKSAEIEINSKTEKKQEKIKPSSDTWEPM